MKKSIFHFLFFAILVIPATGFAQVISANCYNNNQGYACVGECGPLTAGIAHTVACTTIVSSIVQPHCVGVKEFSLCPSHKATVQVYVNGNYVTGGIITSASQTFPFKTVCGDNIKVILSATPLNNGINCVRLGNAAIVLNSKY